MTDDDLIVHREAVQSAWVDYNGHLNVAYYSLIFDHATDVLLDALGVGASYAGETGFSTFVVEAHTRFLNELSDGAPVRVTTQLLGFDSKRLHYFHRMQHDGEGFLAATQELLSVHVDLNERRAAPFPEGALQTIADIAASHEHFERPEKAGASIRPPAPNPDRK